MIGTLRERIAYMGRELITEISSVNLPMYVISDEIPKSFWWRVEDFPIYVQLSPNGDVAAQDKSNKIRIGPITRERAKLLQQ
jgi:hypothetical protein